MGLRAKFNLMLLIVAVAGVALFALAATPVLNGLAKDEMLQTSRIMMASAAGARKYTAEEIAPLLKRDMAASFHPQAVSAYAAKKSFAVLRTRFNDYTYREAALNPTNPEDQASDWEADIINDFRAHPERQEAVLVRDKTTGQALTLARPLINAPACLQCHSTPGAGAQSMVAIYGPDHGFGWKPGDIIGAQIVSVPMSLARARVDQVRMLFLIPYVGVFLLLFLLLNVLLDVMVIGPIDRMAKTSEAVSMGGPRRRRNTSARARTRSPGCRPRSTGCGAACRKPCACCRIHDHLLPQLCAGRRSDRPAHRQRPDRGRRFCVGRSVRHPAQPALGPCGGDGGARLPGLHGHPLAPLGSLAQCRR